MINAESGQPSDPVQASLDELAVDSVMAERVEEERAEESRAAADESIGRQATAGVFWLTAQRWAIRLLGFVTIAVLTRLLSPEDFGTVAAASTVLPFFFLIADLGFAAYIVQVKDADRRMLSTAFWFSLIAGVLLCAVMVAIAPLLGVVFHDERVTPVLQSLSLWVVLTAFGSVPMALLRRRMQVRILALQGAVAAVIAQVVAMAVAFAGLGVWALVAQSLVAPAVTTLLAWITSRWRPAMLFSWREFRVMAGFGGQVLGVEFVAMLRAWGEAAVISGTLGIAALGYMSIAQRLVQVVQDLTAGDIRLAEEIRARRVRRRRRKHHRGGIPDTDDYQSLTRLGHAVVRSVEDSASNRVAAAAKLRLKAR